MKSEKDFGFRMAASVLGGSGLKNYLSERGVYSSRLKMRTIPRRNTFFARKMKHIMRWKRSDAEMNAVVVQNVKRFSPRPAMVSGQYLIQLHVLF